MSLDAADTLAPPVMKRIDDPQELMAQIVECLEAKDSRGLKTYILQHKLKNQSMFWELILKIGAYINEDHNENHQEFFDVCNRCLSYLVKVGNPKETLLAVLEQMDPLIGDIKFKCSLPLLLISLRMLPKKLFHSLDITLETVCSHIKDIPAPENIQLDGDEVKLFHIDKTVVRLIDNTQALFEFLDPFCKAIDLSLVKSSNEHMQEAIVLKKHLVQLFNHPLCHLILTHDAVVDKYKTDGRLCAEQAMVLLSCLETNFYNLLDNNKAKSAEGKETLKDLLSSENGSVGDEELDNEVNEKRANKFQDTKSSKNKSSEGWDSDIVVTPFAQACIAYLIHCEYLGLEKFPAVLTHKHMLTFHLETVSLLLESTIYPVNMKGLLLARSLVQLVDDSSIANDELDNPGYLKVLNNLIVVMTKCPVKEHRLMATQIFSQIITKFVSAGRHKIYVNILSSCTHSGVKGYLITCIKDDIARYLNKRKAKDQINEKDVFFEGKHLKKLMNVSLNLPEKETTDMLENSDQIISGLNLLRYLFIADPAKSNLTNIWDFVTEMEKSFISPLRKGLDISKAHYKLELENVKSGAGGDWGAGPEMSVEVSGLTLPHVEKGEKVALVKKALLTHDIMIGLVARLSELIDQNNA